MGGMKTKIKPGQRYNQLVVLELVGRSKNRLTIWDCRCDCGNITQVRSSNLINGNTKSCGCRRGLRWKPQEEPLIYERVSGHQSPYIEPPMEEKTTKPSYIKDLEEIAVMGRAMMKGIQAIDEVIRRVR
jgi:hypothetical protein